MSKERFSANPLLGKSLTLSEERRRLSLQIRGEPGRELVHAPMRGSTLDELRPAVVQQQPTQPARRLHLGQRGRKGDLVRTNEYLKAGDIEIAKVEDAADRDGHVREVGHRRLEVGAGSVDEPPDGAVRRHGARERDVCVVILDHERVRPCTHPLVDEGWVDLLAAELLQRQVQTAAPRRSRREVSTGATSRVRSRRTVESDYVLSRSLGWYRPGGAVGDGDHGRASRQYDAYV